MVYIGEERRKKPRLPTDTKDKGHEVDFLRQDEMEFKVIARRNKLLGLWAAERMGMPGASAEEYAKEVVVADFDEPGDEDVLEKVLNDLTDKGLEITDAEVRKQMDKLIETAREQIMKELKSGDSA